MTLRIKVLGEKVQAFWNEEAIALGKDDFVLGLSTPWHEINEKVRTFSNAEILRLTATEKQRNRQRELDEQHKQSNLESRIRYAKGRLRVTLAQACGALPDTSLEEMLGQAETDVVLFRKTIERANRQSIVSVDPKSVETSLLLYGGPLFDGYTVRDPEMEAKVEEMRQYYDDLFCRGIKLLLHKKSPLIHNVVAQKLVQIRQSASLKDQFPNFLNVYNQVLAENAGKIPLADGEVRQEIIQAKEPPLVDNPEPPNNLEQQVTSFVGREKEMADIRQLLDKTRLLTLTGSGGCGKTRLALQTAGAVLMDYPDGVWLVELAPLTDPALVTQTVAQTLGVAEEPGKPLARVLVEALKARRMLLVLDNCEHLLDACAQLANALIRSCPNLKIVASSQEKLGIAGEILYRVPSLSLPDPKQAATPASLAAYEAVRLFVDRATSAIPTFAVTNTNAPALASVCHRLDGIPLALEMAAARLRSLSVEQINVRLDDRFRLLTVGNRIALPRHQTLRALMDWSYETLDAREQMLLNRLSVFAGGWTLEAAEQVCSGERLVEAEVLDSLALLVDKSLVVAEDQGEVKRYRLLESIRQYAVEKLLEREETESVERRHRKWCLALVEAFDSQGTETDLMSWLRQMEKEYENLRAAMQGSLAKGEPEEGLRFCGVLQVFWATRGYISEGREWCERALNRADAQEPTQARTRTLNAAGILAYYQSDFAAARDFFGGSLQIRREREDQKGIADTLNNLGLVAFDQGDYDAARKYFEESLFIRQERKEPDNIAYSLNNLGLIAHAQGDYITAKDRYEESLRLCQHQKNQEGIAYALANLGHMANAQGNYAIARTHLQAGLTFFREAGDQKGIAESLAGLGLADQVEGNYAVARDRFEESLSLRHNMKSVLGSAESLEDFAGLAAVQNQIVRAVRLWGAAEAIRDQIGVPRMPNRREEYARNLATARANVGEAAFITAWTEGQRMTMEEAIAYALADTGD